MKLEVLLGRREVVRMRNEKAFHTPYSQITYVTQLRENLVHPETSLTFHISWTFKHSDPFNCSSGSCPSLLATL